MKKYYYKVYVRMIDKHDIIIRLVDHKKDFDAYDFRDLIDTNKFRVFSDADGQKILINRDFIMHATVEPYGSMEIKKNE